MSYRKNLIEVTLPLKAINKAAREKSIRQGHPSTLHLWWAWLPLAASANVLGRPAASATGGFSMDSPSERDRPEAITPDAQPEDRWTFGLGHEEVCGGAFSEPGPRNGESGPWRWFRHWAGRGV
jgi:hypothetical protein